MLGPSANDWTIRMDAMIAVTGGLTSLAAGWCLWLLSELERERVHHELRLPGWLLIRREA